MDAGNGSNALPLAALRAEAVGDWEACGDTFYAREHLYDMAWQDVDLEQKLLCCAPFGGPIAAMRDDSKMVVVAAGASTRPVVRLFSAAGAELGSFLWERGPIAGWGWSDQQELVIVERSGRVHFYTLQGSKLPKEVTFGPQVEAEGISMCTVYGDGVVVVTAVTHAIWAVTGFKEARATKLAALPEAKPLNPSTPQSPDATPRAIAVIEPRHSLSSGLEVIVAVGGKLWAVDDTSATDYALPGVLGTGGSGASALAVSPDGQFLAVFMSDGRLLVMSADFSKQLCEFATKSEVAPQQLAWCGCDAVSLRWEGLLLLVGPYGDWLRLASDEPVTLVTEVDCVRLVGGGSHHMLRRVADSRVQVFKPGSTSPAAQLWDARELYDAGSARADKLLRDGKGQLGEAVKACIDAAGGDLSVPRQRLLLRAAVFGRAFCDTLPPLLLHETAQKLRLLNAVRDPAVGMPLTMAQLEALTLPVLVSRLVNARHYLLAYRIAELLGAGQEQVLLHWACAKISASQDVPDAQLRELLVHKMRISPHARFAPLAAHAQSVGRRSLAIKLLEEEASPAQQVPLLLSLAKAPAGSGRDGAASPGGEDDDTLARALKKAIESGDTDLVYLVLFAAYRAKPLPDFWALVGSRMLARNLFVKYARAKEPELLETLYATQPDAGPDAAELALHEAAKRLATASSGSSSGRPDEASVTKFVSSVSDAGHKYGQSREHTFTAKAAGEWSLLMREQAKLERDTGQALFLGLSLVDTLKACIRLGNAKAAAHFKKLFSVAEPRWYWLKIRTLSEAHDWDALDAFAGERRSPIGWEPFLQAAAANNAPREYQARIIARMPDSRAKAEAYAGIEYTRQAAEVAAKLRDGDLFGRIQEAVSANSPAGLAIAQIKDRFQSTFR